MTTAAEVDVRTWPEVLAALTAIEAENPGRYFLLGPWHERRTIAEELRTAPRYQPGPDERWVVQGADYFKLTASALAVWTKSGAGGTPHHSERMYTVKDTLAPKPEPRPPLQNAPERWNKSTVHPGLLWLREGTEMTFRHGRAESTFDLRSGQEIASSDSGNFPGPVLAFIRSKVAAIQPPHRREKPAPAATGTDSTEMSPQEDAPPILIATAEPVKEETPMLDLSNSVVVAQVRATAININRSVGIPDIEARRADLRARHLTVEKENRRAEIAVDETKRRLSDVKGALKDRGDELILVVSEMTVTGQKSKYPSASALSTAVKTALKTDAAYLAIQTEIKAADAAVKVAGNDDKPGAELVASQKRDALAAREAAIGDALAAEQVADTSPRYGTVDAKNAAAIGARKEDKEYLVIKAEVAKYEQALYAAEIALADAKAEQRAMTREWDDLNKANDLAVARINAFAGLDAPAPAATSPAPVSTQNTPPAANAAAA
ncbi:MAG: hypothetical protein PHS14_16400 [Elusimicrobia bacterium]|nr:hypothetical protein [Elusimicrobiota bacterium]